MGTTCSHNVQTVSTNNTQPEDVVIPTASLITDPADIKAEAVENEEETIDQKFPICSKIVYLDNRIWSVGQIHELNLDGIVVVDCFTGEKTTFKSNSSAINQRFISPIFPRRPADSINYLGVYGSKNEITESSYVDSKIKNKSDGGDGDDKDDKDDEKNSTVKNDHAKLQRMYRYREYKHIQFDELTIGKKIKIYFQSWSNNYCSSHTFVHGYVFGIGEDHAMLILRVCCGRKTFDTVKLVISREHCKYLSEPCASDNEIKLLNSVMYNSQFCVISDVVGDMVKLTGIDRYVNRSAIYGINPLECGVNDPKTLNIGDYLRS